MGLKSRSLPLHAKSRGLKSRRHPLCAKGMTLKSRPGPLHAKCRGWELKEGSLHAKKLSAKSGKSLLQVLSGEAESPLRPQPKWPNDPPVFTLIPKLSAAPTYHQQDMKPFSPFRRRCSRLKAGASGRVLLCCRTRRTCPSIPPSHWWQPPASLRSLASAQAARQSGLMIFRPARGSRRRRFAAGGRDRRGPRRSRGGQCRADGRSSRPSPAGAADGPPGSRRCGRSRR